MLLWNLGTQEHAGIMYWGDALRGVLALVLVHSLPLDYLRPHRQGCPSPDAGSHWQRCQSPLHPVFKWIVICFIALVDNQGISQVHSNHDSEGNQAMCRYSQGLSERAQGAFEFLRPVRAHGSP